MPLDAPFKLGPFLVDGDGRLSPSTPDKFPSFSVLWRGHVVQARLTAAGPEGGDLALQAMLGRVPSTGRPGGAGTLPRQVAFATLRALPETLPAGWKLRLLADHRIVAEAQIHISLPASAEELVSELTLFLLHIAPYFDLLAEGVGVEPPEQGGAASDGGRT